ncbi:alpha/beta hydrolase [Treponema primitia]|uniref:alpha/beta hydrolase n=1 Tax=Treponema primitia TaxID=88058 RepID=UPI00397F7A67
MVEEWITSDDGARLFLRRWMPQGPARAVLLIVHGMAEHSLRYEPLALRLAKEGFEVWAADARGHGMTADRTVNDPGKGGLLGHCADRNGFFRVVADINILVDAVKAAHPELPLYILGHSWGSFLTQAYIEAHGDRLSGCLLSGTRGPDGLKITLGAPLMGLIAMLRGSRRHSRLSVALADGAYNKPFRPNRTPFDWLSRDDKQTDAFAADPLCGNICSSGFYRDLLRALGEIHRPQAMDRIPRTLPIYIFCGSADPVGDMGKSPSALISAYRSMGIRDLEFVLYPDARHELLNETNREEVMGNILRWLTRRLP